MTASRFTCLVVEDDPNFATMLSKLVAAEGGSPTTCPNLRCAREHIERQTFDLVILDNRLPDGTGYEFYPTLVKRSPASIVVMITGAPELSQAVQLTRNGLFDYLTKPIDTADFIACLRRAGLRLQHGADEQNATEMVGSSPAVREVRLALQQAARHLNATVLLLGETGTGKDLAARELHRLTYGPQAATAPYVPLNCPTVPAEMFEAELFGSEKGSYTGADRRRTGLVEAAEGGTLFLDEVSEIPLPLQSKLLRFLESREYRSLGATPTRQFSGRVVAATNRSLREEVRQGRFREDLMYRLDVLTIRIPPLRERLADIDVLAETLLTQLSRKYDRHKPLLKSEDLQRLRTHSFPGNIRELRNLLERSLLRTPESSAWLAMDLGWLPPTHAPLPNPAADEPSPPTPSRNLTPIEQQEFQLIQQALREERGGIRRAAARLGLTHQALLRRLQKWPELRNAHLS